jgi:SAM-dependent methyltransferase
MERILEPELMEDDAQAHAYSEADFAEAHDGFVRLLSERFDGHKFAGFVLDLGCGPADVSLRFARAFTNCTVHGVDGSGAMLKYGRERIADASDGGDRIVLIHGYLPGVKLTLAKYDAVISNSLLHHLPEPRIMWDAVRQYAASTAPVFVMDLMRPDSTARARELVDTYTDGEPEVLRRDFYNSLLAAFEPGEIEAQLRNAGLQELKVEEVTDRHLIVWGYAP